MGNEHLHWLRSVPDPVALLEGMFAHAPVAYQIYRPDGRSLLVNDAFLQLFGAQPPPEYNVLEDEVAEANGQLAVLKRAFRGETVETTPTWYDPRELKKVTVTEGRRCAMICSAFPLFDAAGAIANVVFVFKDVTAELQAQERAEAERDLLRAIIDQSGDGIIVADAAGELTIFNRAAAEQHGASGRGLRAARWAELVPLFSLDGEPLPFDQLPLSRTLVAGTISEGRWRVRRPDGVTRTISGTAAPITRPDGKRGGAILVTRDETDRLLLEAQVGAIGAQLRAIVEHSPNALYLKDLQGHHLWMSPGYERRSGRPMGSFAGKTARELFPPEMAAIMEENDRRVIETRAQVTAEETVPEHDGPHTYLTAKFPVLDADGALTAIGGLSTDITEIKQAEQRLRQSEERFTRYFQVSPFPAVITTLDGRILDVNPAGERFAGLSRSQFLGRDGAELNLWLRPEDRQRVADVLARDGRVRDHEGIVETPDGRRHHVLLSVEKMDVDGECRLLATMHDLTEHVRLQDDLRQSQKMEAVGRLAGGVAHDFNNLLTALSGYNSLLLAALPADDARRNFAERVAQAAQRASALTHQLLAFSRKQPMEIEDLDINEVIRSTTDMLRRLIGEDVALSSELSPRLDSVRADRAQIEQVIVNLVVNARDAMPHGGRILLTTANVRIERGDFVRFTVRDTGVGIDQQARARLFEPFYTTKGPGKGTGLGLATVYGIVKQAGGQVRVESEPGRGALFEVLLPRSTRVAARLAPVVAPPDPPRGRGTILLVEDDDSVRDFVGFVLRQQGYDVLDAEHGSRALELAHAHEGEIDLLLSDVVMPYMSGFEVAEALRRSRPTLRVLHISGYPGDGMTGDAAFLAKPFSRETLLERVGQLIASRSDPDSPERSSA
jgi:two-component system cell cycle sensor histidine kinase/response regulator CckA